MNVIIKVRKELKERSSEKRQRSAQRFFKENIKCYGLSSSDNTKISKENYQYIKGFKKKEVFDICEVLFKSGYLEEFMIGADWVQKRNREFVKSDFLLFEKWVNNYIDNWAKCDVFCNHTVGTFIEMFPDYLKKLMIWGKSKNKWVRRASAVSLIIPARKGLFFKDIIKICDTLLLDQEDMVQKGYGWLLKVAADKRQKEVLAYVIKNKSVMPRTSLRYAIEKMPKELKAKAMSK